MANRRWVIVSHPKARRGEQLMYWDGSTEYVSHTEDRRVYYHIPECKWIRPYSSRHKKPVVEELAP